MLSLNRLKPLVPAVNDNDTADLSKFAVSVALLTVDMFNDI